MLCVCGVCVGQPKRTDTDWWDGGAAARGHQGRPGRAHVPGPNAHFKTGGLEWAWQGGGA